VFGLQTGTTIIPTTPVVPTATESSASLVITAEQPVCYLSGAGIIDTLWFTMSNDADDTPGFNESGMMNVYTDGNTTPDISADFGTLFLSQNVEQNQVAAAEAASAASAAPLPPRETGTASLASGATTVVVTHGLGQTPSEVLLSLGTTTMTGSKLPMFATSLTSTQFTINVTASTSGSAQTIYWEAIGAVPTLTVTAGASAHTTHMGVDLGFNEQLSTDQANYVMKFPIPFGSGVVITQSNPAGSTVSDGLYFQAIYRPGVTDSRRLKSTGITWADAINVPYTAASQTLATIMGSGVAVWFSFIAQGSGGTVGETYLERPFAQFLDGAATPQLTSSGSEDFFFNGYYFMGHNAPYSTEWMVLG
jgi:hypothetical protein